MDGCLISHLRQLGFLKHLSLFFLRQGGPPFLLGGADALSDTSLCFVSVSQPRERDLCHMTTSQAAYPTLAYLSSPLPQG